MLQDKQASVAEEGAEELRWSERNLGMTQVFSCMLGRLDGQPAQASNFWFTDQNEMFSWTRFFEARQSVRASQSHGWYLVRVQTGRIEYSIPAAHMYSIVSYKLGVKSLGKFPAISRRTDLWFDGDSRRSSGSAFEVGSCR